MAEQWTPKQLREHAENRVIGPLASNALRFVAELFELADDDKVSSELIGIRVRNQLNHL